MPSITCLAGWRLIVEGDDPVLAHAAEELRLHLTSAGGAAGCEGDIRLAAGEGASDGFTIEATDGSISVEGDNPRGALNGVYWLLEQLGFAWVEPGLDGAAFNQGRTLAPGRYGEQPSFARRTLILGQDALHDDWPAWLEWASRNRLNDVFFHDTPPSRLVRTRARPKTAQALAADRGGWLFERWDADGQAIREDARRRGLTLQFGGHHLPALVRRALFDEHPDWFPLRQGARDSRYNLCISSAGAVDQLRRGAEAFYARFPGADVYHLWADDIRGGGWCECDGCRGLSPSDQALAATNTVAETLERLVPGARIAHLAYHDTVQPPSRVQPAANVLCLWAPRERCYAHGIADASCAMNRDEYWRPFRGLLDVFGNDPARVQVFEYYSDAILFKGLAPTHLAVLPADAAAYSGSSANIQDLMVGDRPWVGPPWHAWWFARCAWRASANLRVELDRFCAAAFPDNAAAMVGYYRAQEDAYRLFLDLHDLRRHLHRDVLDYSDAPRSTLSVKAAEAIKAAAGLGHAGASLASLSASSPAESARLERERAQASAVAAASAHLAERTAAWDAALAGQVDRALARLAEAERHLDALDSWDSRWNTPAYAVITSGMRRGMGHNAAEVRRISSS